MAAVLFLALILISFSSIHEALGGITCENLDRSTCAFAVSSSGMRCVLEKQVVKPRGRGMSHEHFYCRSSVIEAGNIRDWIETDGCVAACGLSRNALGVSSDSFLEPHSIRALCSPGCYHACSNIVDLYSNLAAGEGLVLPELCAGINVGASAPKSSSGAEKLVSSPAMAPM